MLIGKRTILLLAAVGAVVTIRLFIVELFKWSLDLRISDLILNICTVVTILGILFMFLLLFAGAQRAKENREENEKSKIRNCSSCGYRLNYLKGNGWYCEKCMKYEK